MHATDIFSLFLSVFLTLAFILLLAWFFLYWMGRSAPLTVNSRHIRILDRVVVDRDKYLLLVSVGDKTMLVAMSSSGSEKLCEFSPEQRAELFAEEIRQPGFSEILKQMTPFGGKGQKGR